MKGRPRADPTCARGPLWTSGWGVATRDDPRDTWRPPRHALRTRTLAVIDYEGRQVASYHRDRRRGVALAVRCALVVTDPRVQSATQPCLYCAGKDPVEQDRCGACDGSGTIEVLV